MSAEHNTQPSGLTLEIFDVLKAPEVTDEHKTAFASAFEDVIADAEFVELEDLSDDIKAAAAAFFADNTAIDSRNVIQLLASNQTILDIANARIEVGEDVQLSQIEPLIKAACPQAPDAKKALQEAVKSAVSEATEGTPLHTARQLLAQATSEEGTSGAWDKVIELAKKEGVDQAIAMDMVDTAQEESAESRLAAMEEKLTALINLMNGRRAQIEALLKAGNLEADKAALAEELPEKMIATIERRGFEKVKKAVLGRVKAFVESHDNIDENNLSEFLTEHESVQAIAAASGMTTEQLVEQLVEHIYPTEGEELFAEVEADSAQAETANNALDAYLDSIEGSATEEEEAVEAIITADDDADAVTVEEEALLGDAGPITQARAATPEIPAEALETSEDSLGDMLDEIPMQQRGTYDGEPIGVFETTGPTDDDPFADLRAPEPAAQADEAVEIEVDLAGFTEAVELEGQKKAYAAKEAEFLTSEDYTKAFAEETDEAKRKEIDEKVTDMVIKAGNLGVEPHPKLRLCGLALSAKKGIWTEIDPKEIQVAAYILALVDPRIINQEAADEDERYQSSDYTMGRLNELGLTDEAIIEKLEAQKEGETEEVVAHIDEMIAILQPE